MQSNKSRRNNNNNKRMQPLIIIKAEAVNITLHTSDTQYVVLLLCFKSVFKRETFFVRL